MTSRNPTIWTTAPAADALVLPHSGEIHVWKVAVASVPDDEGTAAPPLNLAERAWDAYVIRRRTRRRIALRRILSRYLRIEAHELLFTAQAHGKPFVVERDGKPSRLQFNMSDSGDHILIAVAIEPETGIDIEAIRPIESMDEIVNKNFSAIECADYRRLAPEQQRLAFFTGWTRKEAYTKAVGLGLHLPLSSFSVTIDPDAPASFIEIDGDPGRAADWTLLPLAVPHGLVGALVSKGPVCALHTWTWPGAD